MTYRSQLTNLSRSVSDRILHCLLLAVCSFVLFTSSTQNLSGQEVLDSPGIVVDFPDMVEETEETGSLVFDEDLDIMDRLPVLFNGKAPTSIEELQAMESHFADLYKRVESSVVNIRAGQGQGSGVVVSSDGYILTAAHVIARPNFVVDVEFSDGRIAKAITLGMERDLDSGMLKIIRMVEPKPEVEEEEAEEKEAEEDDEDADSTDEDKDDSDDDDDSSDDSEKLDDKRKSYRELWRKRQKDKSKQKETEPSKDEEADDEEGDDEEEGDADDDEEEAPGPLGEEEDESDDEDPDADDDTDDDEESDDKETDEESADEESADEEEVDEKRVDPNLPSFDDLDIGLSSDLNRGQWVMAIGHPGGLDPKRGMVMRVGRILSADPGKLQSDCTLVGGDSGGPLIDMAGNVIGIHSRIGSKLTDNLHVPVDVFSEKWDRLEEGRILDRIPSLFFFVKGDTTEVEKLSRNRAAARAGIRRGDKILKIGDTEVGNKEEVFKAIQDLRPFDVVEIVVERRGRKRTLKATVGERSK